MENYSLLTGREFMQIHHIKELLSQTYWAQNYTLETIEKALAHSLSFGILDQTTTQQIAFARVITDYTTRYYIVDVVVDRNYRHKGIANRLIEAIVSYPDLASLRGLLITKNAESLYKKFGFEKYDITCMERTAFFSATQKEL